MSPSQIRYGKAMPKAMQKLSGELSMVDQPEQEDTIEIEDEGGDEAAIEASTHRIANPTEAKQHIQHLDEALKGIMAHIDGGEVKDMLKGF